MTRQIGRSSSGTAPRHLLSDDGGLINIIRCRLKKVQGKKKRDAAAADAEKALLAAETADIQPKDEGPVEASADLLSSKDEDVIF